MIDEVMELFRLKLADPKFFPFLPVPTYLLFMREL
jgi:hypothetical protein